MVVPFNKPYLVGKELFYISQSVLSGHISGNGMYTKKCQAFFEKRYGFKKTLLTTSCTDALEMCAMLLDIEPGDEVIMPSYTFVSTALAFVRQGAKIIFADSCLDRPGIDESQIEKLITSKTKAIVVVHYAGVSCNMAKIMDVANRNGVFVVEDAAQAIESSFDGEQLGGIGHLGTFSFHETKNIQCGEGGLLVINDDRFLNRAEVLWEKGTNRAEFFRGEINKYGWVDTGSSFLPSEIVAAFLYAQLEELSNTQQRRKDIWQRYYDALSPLAELNFFSLPKVPDFATNNGHMFYLTFSDSKKRTAFIKSLKEQGVSAVFHYQSLHQSEYYKEKYEGGTLNQADYFTESLVRLPLFYELWGEDLDYVVEKVISVLESIK